MVLNIKELHSCTPNQRWPVALQCLTKQTAWHWLNLLSSAQMTCSEFHVPVLMLQEMLHCSQEASGSDSCQAKIASQHRVGGATRLRPMGKFGWEVEVALEHNGFIFTSTSFGFLGQTFQFYHFCWTLKDCLWQDSVSIIVCAAHWRQTVPQFKKCCG